MAEITFSSAFTYHEGSASFKNGFTYYEGDDKTVMLPNGYTYVQEGLLEGGFTYVKKAKPKFFTYLID